MDRPEPTGPFGTETSADHSGLRSEGVVGRFGVLCPSRGHGLGCDLAWYLGEPGSGSIEQRCIPRWQHTHSLRCRSWRWGKAIGHVLAQEAITTSGQVTSVQAGIHIGFVAIIAGFAGFLHAVTTASRADADGGEAGEFGQGAARAEGDQGQEVSDVLWCLVPMFGVPVNPLIMQRAEGVKRA